MSESVSAACIKSLCQSLCQAEKSTLSPLECLSFANTIQADLPTCGKVCLEKKFTNYFFITNHVSWGVFFWII